MPARIRTAHRNDLPDIIRVMNAGFEDDPTASWGCPDQNFETVHSRVVGILAEPALAAGTVHVFEDFSAAAVWYPPGAEIDEDEIGSLLEEHPLEGRMQRVLDLFAACEEFRPSVPYWELELLAVDPGRQGHGLGADLLSHGLEVFGAGEMPVYLESSNPRNLSFYKRHGFR